MRKLLRTTARASSRTWGFRWRLERVEIEDDVFDALVAQVSFERRHDAASPRQYRGANNIVRGGSPAGKELAIENAMQVRRNPSHVQPSSAMAAAAVHFKQMIPACDGLCPAAFRIGTAGRPRQQKAEDAQADEPWFAV